MFGTEKVKENEEKEKENEEKEKEKENEEKENESEVGKADCAEVIDRKKEEATMITLYHYTNSSGYSGIQSSETIRKATRHSKYGEGVYFNSRRVNQEGVTKFDVAYDNYRGGASANMSRGYVDYAVAVEFPESDVECHSKGRNLWRYAKELDLTKYTHHFIEF